MNDEKMREAFERYSEERNNALLAEGHSSNSKWFVSNHHWPTWVAAQKALAESAEKIEELPPIWFMHENHIFTKLTGPVEQCLATLERLLNEGNTYGMLCSKREGFEKVHQGGTDDRVNFLNRCKEVLEQHLNKPAETEQSPGQSPATSASQTPDGWYFEFNNNAVSFTTDPEEAADIIRHLEPDETFTEYFKRPAVKLTAQEPAEEGINGLTKEKTDQTASVFGLTRGKPAAHRYLDEHGNDKLAKAGVLDSNVVAPSGIRHDWDAISQEPAKPAAQEPYPEAVRKALADLNSVALVAHHGGLIGLSESDALNLIRKLTVKHHDWKQTIREAKAALDAVKGK